MQSCLIFDVSHISKCVYISKYWHDGIIRFATQKYIFMIPYKGMFTREAARVLGSEMERQGVHMRSDS